MADKDDRENERIRSRVEAMYTKFVSEVDPKAVLDHLFQERIISLEKKEEVMSGKTKNDRCRALLDHLLTSSNKEAFIVLKKALKEHYHWIVERIDTTDSSSTERKSELCNICSKIEKTGDIPEATMRCLNCFENYCLRCSTIHTNQKMTKDHKIVDYKSASIDEDNIKKMLPPTSCKKHSDKMLDYYCCNCKTVVCISCFVADHKQHDYKNVDSVEKNFRDKLEKCCEIMSAYPDQYALKKLAIERQRKEFLAKTLETEEAIRTKGQQLKTLIEQHTQDLLDELSLLRQKHENLLVAEMEETGRKLTVFETFRAFCIKLKSTGSARDVCGCADDLIKRANELIKDCEECLQTPYKSVEIEFNATDQNAIFPFYINSILGTLAESVKQLESHAIVIGKSDADNNISNEVIKINLNRPEDISSLPPVPTEMRVEAAAAVYCNSIFVTGIGNNSDEIWKFDETSSSWIKCASIIQGRRRHSVAFVNQILYICGGYKASDESSLDDVEAYDATNDNCKSVGKLKQAVHSSGNCVPFRDSLYIFGGIDVKNKALSSVQVYDTKTNTSSLLSKPMPRASLLQAVLWKNTVILLGCHACFTYNFDTETWLERDHFKTGVDFFGVTISNGKIFVIGGGEDTIDENGKVKWDCRDDINYIPIVNILNGEPTDWSHHNKLPFPLLVHVFEEIKILV